MPRFQVIVRENRAWGFVIDSENAAKALAIGIERAANTTPGHAAIYPDNCDSYLFVETPTGPEAGQ